MCYIWSQWHQPCDKEHCTYIWHVSLNKHGYDIAYIAHTTNMLHGQYRPNKFTNVCHNTTNCNSYFPCYCQIYVRHKQCAGLMVKALIKHAWALGLSFSYFTFSGSPLTPLYSDPNSLQFKSSTCSLDLRVDFFFERVSVCQIDMVV